MKQYDYKVAYFNANVTQKDLDKGDAGDKVAAQMEIKLQEMMDNNYEYYGITECSVKIESGCGKGFGGKNAPTNVTIPVNIFRKEK